MKNELISQDKKNENIIVPILRGRDLKRYNYTFSNYYLINSNNGLKSKNIEPINVVLNYPSIFNYFLKYEDKLKKRYDQGKHWTNLRNCAYLEDFSKPKIIWGELSDKAKFTYPSFNEKNKKNIKISQFFVFNLNYMVQYQLPCF